MNDEGNRYGFTENVDTHMMKNSEWAVVAYLSQSKYGKLGNVNFTGANKEVYSNNSNQYITGCSSGQPSASEDYGCQYTYDINISGTGASITGTIYGIYDMAGGAFDYVMGNYNDEVGNSGFEIMPESKYYDKYTSTIISEACNGKICFSHALSETYKWYNDSSSTLIEPNVWMLRGSSFIGSSSSGLFAYNVNNGQGYSNDSFRLVMSSSI